MDNETVVGQNLTSEMQEVGATLVKKLDESDVDVHAALWLYLSDARVWRLFLAIEGITTLGPKEVYRRIQTVIRNNQKSLPGLDLPEISVIAPNDPLIVLLRLAIRIRPSGSGVRFSRNTISGHFIEDAYVYRLRPQ